jgi:xylulokinase
MANYLLGIDIGTTGSKALLINEQGMVLADSVIEYPMFTPQPLWAEQNPADWWNATIQSIKNVMAKSGTNPKDIAGIGLTGQMHGLVLLDAKGDVLRPCIMWNDQRTATECAEITAKVGAKRVLELTGNPVLPGFTLPKILWIRKNEPEIYSRIAKFLLPKDYVRYKLTGEYWGDVSDDSGTSLFDVGKRTWSKEMADAAGVPQEWLADVTESSTASARINSFAAKETSLLEGIPVVGGAGDQAAQAVGTGIIDEGIISVTTGTSGVIFAASDEYRVEPEGRLHAFCHAVPGKWHLMGVMLSAGGSFRWYRDTFGDLEKRLSRELNCDPYDLLTGEAEKIAIGSDGLIFLPYLTGERTPYPNPNAKGVFFGVTVRHTKAHFTKAVLEGVTFGLSDSLELMKGLGIGIREIRASGGGARSPLWRQIMADIFNSELVTVNVTEGAAFGAALLAGVGSGVYKTVEDACKIVIKKTGEVKPNLNAHIYNRYYERYRALYKALEKEFDLISDLKK